MNNRDWGIYLIPFLAVLAIYFPLTSGNKPPVTISTPSPAQGEAQPATKPEKDLSHGAAALLAQFLGKDSVVAEDFENYELDFLIATVPDPIDSSLGYMFDRHVSAIQLASEAAGYVPDRSDLPWQDKEDMVVQQGKAIARYKLDRLGTPQSKEDSKPPRHRREPGVIVFRGTGRSQNPHLLIVFLVGETPTVGIHKTALRKTFDQVSSMCRWGNKPKCSEIRLLAPTFSGSADSLQVAIEGWPEGKSRPKFTVLSGSATAISENKIKQLRDRNAIFHATVLPDAVTTKNLLDYLTSTPINAKPREIAFLIEGTTGYGQEIKEQRQPEEQRQERKEQRQTPLILRYPFHISQLRQAAEKAKASTKESPVEAPSLRPRNLRLSLEEATETKDVVPPFSQFEVFSVELVLSNILSTISREGVRYLGLISTDIRDQIFLARAIRTHSPNVVLFGSGADLIYLHSDINLDFQGMLLVTTYPLFSRNQIWTYPFQGEKFRLQFPTDTAEGVYNAALALLGRPDMMLEYGRPFDLDQDLEVPRTPPLWLSAVGKSDVWPVNLLAVDRLDQEDYSYSPPPAHAMKFEIVRTGWPFSRVVVLGLFFLSLSCLGISLVLIPEVLPNSSLQQRLSILWRLRQRTPCLLRWLGDAVFDEYRAKRQLYLFSFLGSVLILSFAVNSILVRIVACYPLTELCRSELAPEKQLIFNLFTFLLLIFLELPTFVIICAVLGRAIMPRRISKRWLSYSARRLCSPAISGPILLFIFLLLLAVQFQLLAPPAALFFYLRTLNLGSGLSPLLPLFFVTAGGLLWSLCSLRRLRLLEEFRAPPLNFRSRSFAGMEILESRIRQLLATTSLRLPGRNVVLLFVGLPCFLLFVGFRSFGYPVGGLVPSIEVWSFYVCFGFAFFLVYLALSMTFLHFLWVWSATRRLLYHLSCHPLLPAYRNLPKKFPQTPRISLSNPSRTLSALEFSVEQAARLSCLANQKAPPLITGTTLGHRLGLVRQSLNRLSRQAERCRTLALRAEAMGNWQKGLSFRNLAERSLSKISRLVVGVLEPEWSSSGAVLSRDEKRWLRSGEHYLAGRAVVFLHHIFLHLQNLIWFVMAGLLLMLFGINSYPFQPREPLLWFNWAVILTVVVLTIIILVQINRDKIVSLLTGTTPGKVSWNQEFIMKLLAYGLVPILALLASQFPEGLRNIVSWLSVSQGAR